ncbi:MAG: AbrB/MazE/SpoVT family DNA-binding domain-containing protein [Acidobacteria bacterium]|nr:MAG: AbrB/MazE/SpoVT family DNA-binding domain-containing protein [Acidobacteriota bacterium]
MKTTVVVGERGQVTIPKKLRDRLGIVPGDHLEFSERQGRLVAQRSDGDYAARLQSVVGILPPFDVDAYLRELRGPAFNPEMDPPSLGPAAERRIAAFVAQARKARRLQEQQGRARGPRRAAK